MLREEFVALVEAFLAFGWGEASEARAAGVEYGSRRHAEADEVVAILARQDEIVLAAVEGAAEQRTSMVNSAALFPEVDASAALVGGKGVERFTSLLIGEDEMPVRLDVVALVGMQQENLPALAAFGTAVARDVARLMRRQTSL